MSKTKTRLIIVLTAIVTIISTLCYAETEAVDANNMTSGDMTRTTATEEANVESSTPAEGAVDAIAEDAEDEQVTTSEKTDENLMMPQPEIHEGDLYLLESNVTMDKLVDGNVFIIGNNVKITGQCSGNMFVFGNNITFDKAYAQSSVFVASGTDITYNAVSNSLYAVTPGNVIIDHQFGVYSDIYVSCNTLEFDGIIGRDAFLSVANVKLGDNGAFYGDLSYISSNVIQFEDGVVNGSINHIEKAANSEKTVFSYIYNIIQFLVIILVAFLLGKIFIKSPATKQNSALSHPFITLGIGILATIIIPAISIGLMFTVVGISAGILLLSAYFMLLSLAAIVLPIAIARYICINKKAKGLKEFLLTLLIATVVKLLTTIPFIGVFIYLIFIVYGIGVIIFTPLLNRKSNSSKIEPVATTQKKAEVTKAQEKEEKTTKDESPIVDSKISEETNNKKIEGNSTKNKEEKSEE